MAFDKVRKFINKHATSLGMASILTAGTATGGGLIYNGHNAVAYGEEIIAKAKADLKQVEKENPAEIESLKPVATMATMQVQGTINTGKTMEGVGVVVIAGGVFGAKLLKDREKRNRTSFEKFEDHLRKTLPKGGVGLN